MDLPDRRIAVLASITQGYFPKLVRHILARVGMTWQSFHLISIESGRGCPYGCEFCNGDRLFRRVEDGPAFTASCTLGLAYNNFAFFCGECIVDF